MDHAKRINLYNKQGNLQNVDRVKEGWWKANWAIKCDCTVCRYEGKPPLLLTSYQQVVPEQSLCDRHGSGCCLYGNKGKQKKLCFLGAGGLLSFVSLKCLFT